ncbi:MAG: hypothetical protein A2W17_04360 [Planctomycetes bacterium RBG_16_41_13]|nr:MAG: hypothetical protein A2W17_04360 [Planctomycetes bacterium RBG_16_41_13]
MKKLLFLFIIVSFLAGCGSGGGGSAPAGGDSNTGTNTGNTGGNKVNPQCSRTGKIAKIKVSKDGIYRVAYSDLYSDCSAVSFALSTISLSNQDADIPIEVVDSNGNGGFDAGDSIEFYGKAIGRDDSRFRFTETNVYWLSVGEKEGKRIKEVTPPANLGPPLMPATSFPRSLHLEEDTWYVQENYPEISSPSDLREHWYWNDRVYPGDKVNYSEDFSTRHIDRGVPVLLKLRLQSVSWEHYINVFVNDKPVSDSAIMWDSQAPYDLELTVSSSFFVDSGLNKLTIESVAGGLFYLDWFDVTYNRKYMAEHNVIEFTGKDFFKLSGFTSNQVSVYEVSDPENVQKVNISDPKKISESNYEVSFLSPFNDERFFVAITSDQKMSLVNTDTIQVEPYTPSDITSNPADYIIITHEDFADVVKTLADYRAAQGYKVLTVKVSDIYNAFGSGIETPHAMKAFLKYAYENWSAKPNPMYVVLVGDATVDYKDLSGYGKSSAVKSYVPAYLYNYPGLGEVPSDNWFVDVNDDILPDMNIGRIPAKFPDDVSSVVSKIISHEGTIKSMDVLLVADDDNPRFEGLSDSIADIIPSGYVPRKVYQGELKDGFKPAITSALNSNPLIVNYTGHGAVVEWANNSFTSGDVAALTNTSYPFVVTLNCLNGYFVLGDEQPSPSIAEAFLLAHDKGAVAVFAASPWGYLSDHDPLAQELYKVLFSENITLGDAVTKAKSEAFTKDEIMEDVVQTFIFFGDPATRLK